MKFSTLILGILTAVVAFTAVKIEVLNLQSGSPLPREEFDGRITTWRAGGESFFVQMKLRDIAANRFQKNYKTNRSVGDVPAHTVLALPLTDSELSDLCQTFEKVERNSEFRSFVQTMGIAQYLLAPITLIFSVIYLCERQPKSERLMGLLALSVASVAILLMFYRAYFSSLET